MYQDGLGENNKKQGGGNTGNFRKGSFWLQMCCRGSIRFGIDKKIKNKSLWKLVKKWPRYDWISNSMHWLWWQLCPFQYGRKVGTSVTRVATARWRIGKWPFEGLISYCLGYICVYEVGERCLILACQGKRFLHRNLGTLRFTHRGSHRPTMHLGCCDVRWGWNKTSVRVGGLGCGWRGSTKKKKVQQFHPNIRATRRDMMM